MATFRTVLESTGGPYLVSFNANGRLGARVVPGSTPASASECARASWTDGLRCAGTGCLLAIDREPAEEQGGDWIGCAFAEGGGSGGAVDAVKAILCVCRRGPRVQLSSGSARRDRYYG